MTLSWLRLLPGIIILALVIGVLVQRSHINSLGHKLDNERAGRLADRDSYKRAQDEAKAKNEAEVAKIEARQKEISDHAKDSYSRDLAELRRLRSTRPAAPGAPGKPGVSGVPQAPGGPPSDGLPLPADEYLRAQEIELRLMHLQRWIAEQLASN